MERKLGIDEETWWRVGQLTPANAIWIVKVSGPLTEDILKRALREIQQVHI